MGSLLDLLRTCLGVCGCLCLDEELWWGGRERGATHSMGRAGSAGALVRPRQQAFRDMEEQLLDSVEGREASGSARGGGGDGDGGGSDQGLAHAVSSSSEEMYRAGSFNTKVAVLRSTSPFYRSQQQAAAGGSGGSGGSGGGSGGGGADIELKTTPSNVLLGQAHFEGRGKFVEAHPVRRGPSPQLGA